MELEYDLTDDVSALSMDGASAIAGMGMAKRLRKDFAKMQLGIPEDEEEQAAGIGTVKKPHKSDKARSKTDGDELLEPFPKTYEEWQKKKEKKHKHKSKKHSKKSSKSGSRSSNNREQREQQHMENIGEKSSLPIMEISIQSTNFQSTDLPPSRSRRRSDDTENVSDLRSAPSIASTEDTSRSRSGIAAAAAATSSSQKQKQQHSSSYTGSGAMGMAIKRSLLQSNQHSSFRSFLSVRSADSSQSHQSHQESHVTIEDLQQLQNLLECSKVEEKQVLGIYQRLEKEVQSATAKATRYKNHQQTIGLELEAASLEREHLQQQLGRIQDENNELHAKLRTFEEREADKGLDDVLDSMESKIKELKSRNKRSKEKRASVDDG